MPSRVPPVHIREEGRVERYRTVFFLQTSGKVASMRTSTIEIKPLDTDMQCWLLTACYSLQSREQGCYPELKALLHAIKEKNRNVIAVALEVVCSHLTKELSTEQRFLTQRLAEEVRSGSFVQIRRTVSELAHVSEQRRPIAA